MEHKHQASDAAASRQIQTRCHPLPARLSAVGTPVAAIGGDRGYHRAAVAALRLQRAERGALRLLQCNAAVLAQATQRGCLFVSSARLPAEEVGAPQIRKEQQCRPPEQMVAILDVRAHYPASFELCSR